MKNRFLKHLQSHLTHQCDRLDVFELDVSDSLEASRFVAKDETHVTDFADRREKLFNVTRATSLRQLHHEDSASVTLFRRHQNLERIFRI